jgi:hypothetical protein
MKSECRPENFPLAGNNRQQKHNRPTFKPTRNTKIRWTINRLPKIIPAMKRILHVMALVLLGSVSLVFVSGCGKPHVLAFRAVVDGSDVVKVSGDHLWIEHEEFQLPAQIFINGKPWHPIWTDKVSAPLQGLSPAFNPRDPMKVKLTQLKGRGPVSIIQLPTSANDQTLAFRIDDSQPGADTYELHVTW